ncbi:hypothetical protein H1C71_007583 [Ictidomys tridecemlineatus]|nr:hypothetical protein H1C71_007583 [Ictidomys tridecemlineatus]
MRGMWTVKTALMRTLLGIAPMAIHVALWQRTCLHCVLVLRFCEAGFKGDGLTNLVEEVSRQHRIEAVGWGMAAFRQIHWDNWEQKADRKDSETLQLGQRSTRKMGAKKVVLKRLSPLKRNQVLCPETIRRHPGGMSRIRQITPTANSGMYKQNLSGRVLGDRVPPQGGLQSCLP